MTTHHCSVYPSDPHCNCYTQGGENQYHFKQFSEKHQTYNCCDQINITLEQMRMLEEELGNFPATRKDFFEKIYEKNFTGCQFDKYLKESTTEEYNKIATNYVTLKNLYDNFINGNEKTKVSQDGDNITCQDPNYTPYILSYRSPGEIYYNYAYICSPKGNEVFNNISTGYGPVDFKITRFYDNSTKQPCINNSCQLIISDKLNNYGDVINQGNSQPVYKSISSSQKDGLIASSVFSIILLIFVIYLFWKFHNKL